MTKYSVKQKMTLEINKYCNISKKHKLRNFVEIYEVSALPGDSNFL